MAMEIVVATRLPLPGDFKDWQFEIDNEEGQIDGIDYERFELDYYGGGLVVDLISNQNYINQICRLIPKIEVSSLIEKSNTLFPPADIFNIRPQNWDLSGVIAYSLCKALGGVVICETDKELPYKIIFESGVPEFPPATVGELERILWSEFFDPGQIVEQWDQEDILLENYELENSPRVAEQRRRDNDWSDV